MPHKNKEADEGPRLLTFAEVGRRLGIDPRTVRDKALVTRQLLAVDVGNGGERATWRVSEEEVRRYIQRITDESQRRFGAA